ncbi:MAG: hypothetical protein WCS87_08615 [Methylococcaceae bacterium]
MHIQLQPEFDDILQPLGSHAVEFFLASCWMIYWRGVRRNAWGLM